MKKLNLGSGFDHRDGYVNADRFAASNPDILMDMEETPWPFEDHAFEHILMKHSLEHVGRDYQTFKAIMQELYRVTKNNGLVEIHVPHFRHDTFWGDPTHVRAFTLMTFKAMSKAVNDDLIARRVNASMTAYDMRVNFEIENAVQIYDPKWYQKQLKGEITNAQLRQFAIERWNVVKEIRITLKAIKPFDLEV